MDEFDNQDTSVILEGAVIGAEEHEFVYKMAETTKEIAQLIEDGFEYICDQQNLKFFRKRK